MPDELEDRIDKIREDARAKRQAEGERYKDFSSGCRRLLKDVLAPLFEKTTAKLRGDDTLVVQWGAENEDELHLKARNKMRNLTHQLQYKCNWPNCRIQRVVSAVLTAVGTSHSRSERAFELADLTEEVLADHLEEFLRLALDAG